ncbi:MAG TPA: methyltransferase domain-containing protein [Polyangia bacterium]|nr:methyltransferase domain-containing protein [Polyangia bacterium]
MTIRTVTPAPLPPRLLEKQARLAKVYDSDVLPLYGRRFGQLALRGWDPGPAADVLEIGCATGDLTLELARRLDDGSHLTALEGSAPLAAQAKAKLAAAPGVGHRVTIHQTATPLHPTLVLPDSVFDVCVSNLGLAEAEEPARTVVELASMLKPGGQLLLTAPLRGTWTEFLDIYRQVLRDGGKGDSLAALEAYVAAQPDGDTCARWLEQAGLTDVEVAVDRWELLFKSAREFFFAPVIHEGPLSRWKHIAGRGDEMQDVFFFTKEAIDAYFAGRIFSVTIVGAAVKGWKRIAAP